jgi:hypothetical protein
VPGTFVYGDVSVSPGSDREIRVRLKKVIYAGEARAKSIAAEAPTGMGRM